MSVHDENPFDAGLAVRRDMFGPAGAEDLLAGSSDFTRPMQELVTRYCFGEVWTRELLDRKTRSLLTIALLVALNRPTQLKVHVKGAIANGATADEIREVLLHSMVYTGVPAGVEAHFVAEDSLKEMGMA